MADDTDQTQDEAKRTKRRLRSSTETVRERSEKFQKKQELDAGPTKRNPVKVFFGGFFWPLRQLGKFLGKLGRFRVFRIIGNVLAPPYIRNSWRELRLVTWPDRKTSWKLTYAVIVFSVLFGLIVYGVDTVLDKLFKELIIN